MGSSGKFGWGGDRRSSSYKLLSQKEIEEKDKARLAKRDRDAEKEREENGYSRSTETATASRELLEKYVASALERVGDSRFAIELMKFVNPEYMSGLSEYKRNCALCTAATAMRLQGYDVEAMPRDETWRGATTIYKMDWNDYDNYVYQSNTTSNSAALEPNGLPKGQDHLSNAGIENKYAAKGNPNKFGTRMPSNVDIAIKAMNKWGSNSVAELSLGREGKKAGHSVALINTSKGVTLFDSQTGNVHVGKDAIVRYLNEQGAVPSKLNLYRLDHLKLRSDAEGKSALTKAIKAK